MCDYVNKNELIEPREIFSEWISNVQSEIRVSLPPYFCIRVVNPYHYIHNKVPCCKFLNCIGLIFSLTTILLLL